MLPRLAASFVLLSLLGFGTIAPAAHAQTYPAGSSPTIAASPSVAVTPTTVVAGSTATVQGHGFSPNNYVFVYWQRPDGTSGGTYRLADATGSFTFTLGFSTAHGTGTEYVSAYDYGTGHWAPIVSVSVVQGTPPATSVLSASPNPVHVGSTTTVSGSGFSPMNYVFVQWQRPDGTVGGAFAYTNSAGTFSFTLGFLAAHGCGTEALQAYDYAAGTWSASYSVSVTC